MRTHISGPIGSLSCGIVLEEIPTASQKPSVECAGSPSDLVRYPSTVRTLMGTKRGRLELEGGGVCSVWGPIESNP